MIDTSNIVRLVVQAVPEVRPHLKGRALAFVFNVDPTYKTQAFFQGTIEHLIQQVYNGYMGGEFIDIMANLIQGQLIDAYTQAWEDDGNTLPLPDFLASALEGEILNQYGFVDNLYRDIIDVRVDGTSIAPLISRAGLWANQWQSAYNNAVALIASETGGKLMWQLGATEEHCETCSQLDGIVAYATEWDTALIHPQNAPNNSLACGGWRCDCSLVPTDQRRSPDALTTMMNIVGSTNG